MSTFARALLLAAAASSLAGCRCGTPPAKSWYEAAPLLESLRTEDRALAASAVGELERLPLYELELELNEGLDAYRLKQGVYYTNTTGGALDEVVLQLYGNAVGTEPLITLERGRCEQGPPCTVTQPSPSVLQVKFDKPLEAQSRLELRLVLAGKLRAIEAGRTSLFAQGLESLGRLKSGKGAGDYGLLSKGDGIASLASFYPVLARREGGAWVRKEASTMGDMGADGFCHVRATISAPPAAKVVSSGITVEQKPGRATDGGLRTEHHVVAGMVRDFSLLASTEIESATRKVGSVEIRSHYLARDAKAGQHVLGSAAGALKVFEKRFGRYPYRDLDVVEAPLIGGAGGVEFSGLVTVASMLYRPALSEGPFAMLGGMLGGGAGGANALTDDMLEFVTAHEVAHQWFPGLVGSDSRAHPFQDESLAQYAALLYVEDRHGAERAEREAERQVAANYHMMRLFGLADGAVDRPVDAFPSEIAYAGLVYGKGPFLYRELRRAQGDAAFFKGLSGYVDKHRFRDAKPRALIESLAQSGQRAKVEALAQRWLEQTHGDDDLGKPEMKRLLAAWMGPEAAANITPQMEAMMKTVLRLLGPGGGDGGDGGLGDLLKLLGPR